MAPEAKHAKALHLLHKAQAFDALAWATTVQTRSPASDIRDRAYVASAHRAAVCIYISRVLLTLDNTTDLPRDLEDLVIEVVSNLSSVHQSNDLFTATTWPAFIAGAETSSLQVQAWVATRFQEIWDVQPWGVIRGALELLEKFWQRQNCVRNRPNRPNHQDPPMESPIDGNWLTDLRQTDSEWLIM